MGKGDQRTRRGKIYRGTYGKRRPRRRAKKKAAAEAAARSDKG
jgi:30S ribosomal protein S31